MATDALLARRASSLPAASQVFIAACKAVEASCKAWAIVGGACDDADQSERPQELDVALLIAAIDHFSGKLLFVISDSYTVAASSFMRLWLAFLLPPACR